MNHQLESRPNLEKTETGVALVCLIVALVSISLAAIFIKWSEQEISPYSTAFNRFWISTIVLLLWHKLSGTRTQEMEQQPQPNSIYTGWVLLQLWPLCLLCPTVAVVAVVAAVAAVKENAWICSSAQ